MRVAIVYKRFAASGGSEAQVQMLCRHLVDAGIEVHVFCRSVRAEPPPGVTLHRMPTIPVGRLLGMLTFSAWARRAVDRFGPFDVTHAFGRTRGQQVYRVGGGCHRTYLEHAHALDRPPWLRAILRCTPYQLIKARVEESALRAATTRRIITNSEMVRDDLLFRYALPPDRLRVVRNGTDLERFRPPAEGERDALRREHGLAADGHVALFVGTGYSRKGLAPTLAAVARLTARHPSLRLVVAGRDGRLGAWRRRADDLGLAGSVLFLGGRNDPERLYRMADVLVLPTAYDPAANATLESLASGTPVVTSTMNGAGELLADGSCGAVVPAPIHPADVAEALETWLSPADPATVRAAARARAEEHPIGHSGNLMLELYEEIARNGR